MHNKPLCIDFNTFLHQDITRIELFRSVIQHMIANMDILKWFHYVMMEMIRMKVKCPICGIQGYLEKHSRGYRIRHYVGFKENKRIYQYHYITQEQLTTLGISGYKQMGINKLRFKQY